MHIIETIKFITILSTLSLISLPLLIYILGFSELESTCTCQLGRKATYITSYFPPAPKNSGNFVQLLLTTE